MTCPIQGVTLKALNYVGNLKPTNNKILNEVAKRVTNLFLNTFAALSEAVFYQAKTVTTFCKNVVKLKIDIKQLGNDLSLSFRFFIAATTGGIIGLSGHQNNLKWHEYLQLIPLQNKAVSA